jgi:transcriptional regulator with XRE-family HTH domain
MFVKKFSMPVPNSDISGVMKQASSEVGIGIKVAARIREFSAARGLSDKALAKAAKLSRAEAKWLEDGSDEMTRDMLDRIADVFGVHPAVLCMFPDEHPFASLLEKQRDLPKAEFQKLAAELISKGLRASKGSA